MAQAARCSLIFPSPSLDRPCSSTQMTPDVQTVAGIISLLNDYLLSEGDAPLGFLNPWVGQA